MHKNNTHKKQPHVWVLCNVVAVVKILCQCEFYVEKGQTKIVSDYLKYFKVSFKLFHDLYKTNQIIQIRVGIIFPSD